MKKIILLITEEDKNDKELDIKVIIDQEGIKERIEEVPVKPGNYSRLAVNDKVIYVMSRETGVDAKSHLNFVKIDNEDVEIKNLVNEPLEV